MINTGSGQDFDLREDEEMADGDWRGLKRSENVEKQSIELEYFGKCWNNG